MRKIIFVVMLYLISVPVFSQIYIDPGFGAVFKDNTGNLSPRFNMGIHNLLFKRLGVYGTIEVVKLPGQKLISETDERDIVGGIFRINDYVSLYGGAGVFSNGVLSNGFRLADVRKEAGISFNIPSARLNIDLGYSNTNKLSANLGFVIPFGKTSKKEKVTEASEASPVSGNVAAKPAPAPQSSNAPGEVSEAPEQKSTSPEPAEALSEPIDISQLQSPRPPSASGEVAENSETFKPGFYAINGAFKNHQNAIDELLRIKSSGFPSSRIGYRPSTGLYYVWLKYSKNDQEIRSFVLQNRESGKLPAVWMLQIN